MFYGVALWKYYTASAINKFRSCINKCMKMFFNYRKMHSVTAILLVLKLPSFDTVVHNHYFTSIRSTDSGLEVLTVSCNN